MKHKTVDTASGATRAQIALLLDFYGNALTERQRRTAEMYFQEDLSLAEIADETGITRQGVRDGLKKAENALFGLEEKLGIAARFRKQKKALAEAKAAAEQLPESDEKHRILSAVLTAMEEA